MVSSPVTMLIVNSEQKEGWIWHVTLHQHITKSNLCWKNVFASSCLNLVTVASLALKASLCQMIVLTSASSLCLRLCPMAVVTTASSHCCLRLITVTSLSLYVCTVITALTTAPSPSLRLCTVPVASPTSIPGLRVSAARQMCSHLQRIGLR